MIPLLALAVPKLHAWAVPGLRTMTIGFLFSCPPSFSVVGFWLGPQDQEIEPGSARFWGAVIGTRPPAQADPRYIPPEAGTAEETCELLRLVHAVFPSSAPRLARTSQTERVEVV